MNKHFVSYEIAVKLKEIGFNERCIATIDETDYLHIKGTKSLPRGAMMYNTVDCPLISQVFGWFREKYTIDCCIEPLGENKRFYSFYILFKNNMEIKGNGNLYKIYEEAQTACIESLIEIVKSQAA